MTTTLFEREEVPEFYVDSVRLAVGPYGFVLDLGLADPPADEAPEKTPEITRLARVRMSPQHALLFARILQKNVALYEEKVGKITLPEQLFREHNLEPE